jgi:hypothetical protein
MGYGSSFAHLREEGFWIKWRFLLPRFHRGTRRLVWTVQLAMHRIVRCESPMVAFLMGSTKIIVIYINATTVLAAHKAFHVAASINRTVRA